jgi:hypothetical protein
MNQGDLMIVGGGRERRKTVSRRSATLDVPTNATEVTETMTLPCMRRLRKSRGGSRIKGATGVGAEACHIQVMRTKTASLHAQTDIARTHDTIEAGRGVLLRARPRTRLGRIGSIAEEGHPAIRDLDQDQGNLLIDVNKVIRL